MALPDSNISVAMVREELRAATNNVGQLCIHPNINMWSKWKPIVHSTYSVITASQLKFANYGLNLNTVANSTDFAQVVNKNWGYSRPFGGANSPYRLGDFRNYYHTALAPMTIQDKEPITVYKATTPNKTFGVAINVGDVNDTQSGIGIQDLDGKDFSGKSISNHYFGLVIEVTSMANVTTNWIITSDKTLLMGGSTIEVDLTQEPFALLGATYKLNYILSYNKFTTPVTLGEAGGNRYLPIPSPYSREGGISVLGKNQRTLIVNPGISFGDNLSFLPKYVSRYRTLSSATLINMYNTTDEVYFPTNRELYIGFEVSGSGTIPSGDWFLTANINHVENPFTLLVPVSAYTSTGTKITSSYTITQPTVLFFGADDIMNMTNLGTIISSVTQGNRIHPSISLHKRANLVTEHIRTTSLKIKTLT